MNAKEARESKEFFTGPSLNKNLDSFAKSLFADGFLEATKAAEPLVEALEKVDRYFKACAVAWDANDGKVVNTEGHIIVEADGLDKLADAAGIATGQVLAAYRKNHLGEE